MILVKGRADAALVSALERYLLGRHGLE